MQTYDLKDLKPTPDPIHSYTKHIRTAETPLVIDNGSYQCRVGWATEQEPCLVFKNLIAKQRKERGKRDGETQVGNDITNIEAVRFQLKTQFDRNVVTHFEAQEQILDYIFTHLGIDTEGMVNHPIIMTEAFMNPNYTRHLMSELLFECYGVPGIAYGVDGLFSFQYNNPDAKYGLVVNCGYHTTHILPVIEGFVDPPHSRRINVGGFHCTNFLHRLLQLRYPSHFAAITPSRAEEILHDHTYMTRHYMEELPKWADQEYYNKNVHKIQLPYVTVTTPVLTAEQQKERRKELAKRLVEINARKREERLAEDEEQLNQLLGVQELFEDGEDEEFQQALESHELSDIYNLQKVITQLQNRIEKTKQRIVATNSVEDVEEPPKPKVRETMDPKERADFDVWLAGIKSKRQEILDRRSARRQRRQDMARRRTAAAQERMRLISQLARKEKRDDNFGLRDEDWDVYKAISKECGDTDSEEEQEQLGELEDVLRRHDPEFAREHEPTNDGQSGFSDPAETHQLHVAVERIRVPEVLFQPSMVGLEQAGITETIEYLLKQYPPQIQDLLVSNVFLTGGCARFPGFVPRLEKELLEMRPFKSKFRVSIAQNPSMDAWYGTREFAVQAESGEFLITREEYDEVGGEYLKEHRASNMYYPSPAPLVIFNQSAEGGSKELSAEVQSTVEEIEVDCFE